MHGNYTILLNSKLPTNQGNICCTACNYTDKKEDIVISVILRFMFSILI